MIPAGVRGFCHFRLREQCKVAANLAEAATRDAKCRRHINDAIPMGVPRHRRHVKAQLFRHRIRDRRAVTAQRRQGSGRTAQLQHHRRFDDAIQARAASPDQVQPPCGLQAERRRARMLQPGPPRHRSRGKLARESGGRGHDAGQGFAQSEVRRTHPKDDGRIRDVLARGTTMHVTRGVCIPGGHRRGQPAHEGNHDVAVAKGVDGQLCAVKRVGAGGRSDVWEAGDGNQSVVRLGSGQRDFNVEQRLHKLWIAMGQHQTSKNTVSFSP
jgi:hypothetical protein